MPSVVRRSAGCASQALGKEIQTVDPSAVGLVMADNKSGSKMVSL